MARPMRPFPTSTSRGGGTLPRRRALSGSAAGRPICLVPGTALLLLAVVCHGVQGQGADLNRIHPGDSVRIRVSGRMTVAAEFHGWEPDRMLLDVNGFADPYPVPLENMERLDAYLERTSQESFRHGAILGAAGGLFIGAALGLVLHTTGVIDDPDAPPSEIVTDSLQWMGFGIVGGTFFGGFWTSAHPSFGWIRIELPVS